MRNTKGQAMFHWRKFAENQTISITLCSIQTKIPSHFLSLSIFLAHVLKFRKFFSLMFIQKKVLIRKNECIWVWNFQWIKNYIFQRQHRMHTFQIQTCTSISEHTVKQFQTCVFIYGQVAKRSWKHGLVRTVFSQKLLLFTFLKSEHIIGRFLWA